MQGKRKNHRRRSESFWRDTIQCWKASGKRKAVFCREQTIALSTFCYWQRRLQVNNPGPVFYPVVVSLKQNVVERRTQPASLRVLFAGKQHSIEIQGDFSENVLRKLVSTLEAMP